MEPGGIIKVDGIAFHVTAIGRPEILALARERDALALRNTYLAGRFELAIGYAHAIKRLLETLGVDTGPWDRELRLMRDALGHEQGG